MGPGRSGESTREILRCADVLGAFGVTAEEVRAFAAGARSASTEAESQSDTADSLERVLGTLLADTDDRTGLVRELICRSDRGFSCPARYDHDTLEEALAAVFERVDWLFELLETRDGVHLTAADQVRRRRERTTSYPETPLETDNLPAVLYAINESILDGTGARFLLLSTGADRWRAAMIREDELERLQERYGRRIAVFDRPLRPVADLAAYVPDADAATPAPADEPWPTWARERTEAGETGAGTDRGRSGPESGGPDGVDTGPDDTGGSGSGDGSGDGDRDGNGTRENHDGPAADGSTVASLIEEAEPDEPTGSDDESRPPDRKRSDDAGDAGDGRTSARKAEHGSTTGPSRSVDGYELSGSPSVSRLGGGTESAAGRKETGEAGEAGTGTDRDGSDSGDGSGHDSVASAGGRATSTDGWSLSGTTTTARVSNESFGTDDRPQSEDDRYRALGAALTTGRDVSVKGLLEDDDFLPELPAAEPEETRVTFEDGFDPDAVDEAKAVAEESGFVWLDSGTVETTRVSNG